MHRARERAADRVAGRLWFGRKSWFLTGLAKRRASENCMLLLVPVAESAKGMTQHRDERTKSPSWGRCIAARSVGIVRIVVAGDRTVRRDVS